MKTRYVERVGTKVVVRKEWGECPERGGEEHEAKSESTTERHLGIGEYPEDLNSHIRALRECDACGASAPDDAWTGKGMNPIWSTGSGQLECGDLYYLHHDQGIHCEWENCDGWHLHAVLPNGHYWNMDQRASNCGRPEDKTHRCWVRHGQPPNVHVDKNGDTCQAGAGSILAGDWHGFLHHGELVEA